MLRQKAIVEFNPHTKEVSVYDRRGDLKLRVQLNKEQVKEFYGSRTHPSGTLVPFNAIEDRF